MSISRGLRSSGCRHWEGEGGSVGKGGSVRIQVSASVWKHCHNCRIVEPTGLEVAESPITKPLQKGRVAI